MEIFRDPVKVNQIRFRKVSRMADTIKEVRKAKKFKKELWLHSKVGGFLKKRLIIAASLCAAVIMTVSSVVLVSGFLVSMPDVGDVPELTYNFDFHAVPLSDPHSRAVFEEHMPVYVLYETLSYSIDYDNADDAGYNQPVEPQPAQDAYYYEYTQEEPQIYPLFEYYIHPGTYSGSVFELQERLIALGFLELENPTNYYGMATRYAVSAFQRQHDLYITGIASPQTLNLLFSSHAQMRSFGEGEANWQISAIQARLALLGYGAVITGVFDEATVGAVMHFQALNGLELTGRVSLFDEEILFSDAPVHADGFARDIALTIHSDDFSAELLIDNALQFIGVRYTWGGKSPATGFDCSGFVYYNLNRSGFEIAYMTDRGWHNTTQFYIVSEKVDIQPGDVLIFRGHVGIYIGGGLMVDASFSAGRVRITDLDLDFWRSAWRGGRRLA